MSMRRFLLLLLPLLLPVVVFAASAASEQANQFSAFGWGAGLDNPEDPRIVAAFIINGALSLLSIVFLAYTVYGGYLIMTAAGDDERVVKGKSIITNGVIGLAVILAAYGITKLVVLFLQHGTQSALPPPCDPSADDINLFGGNKPGDGIGVSVDPNTYDDCVY